MIVTSPLGNRLIDALHSEERAKLETYLEIVSLAPGEATHQPDASFKWVVFPVSCVLSVVATTQDGNTCEVGTIGNEGASGIAAAWGDSVLRTTFCQIGGSAARMSATAFRSCVAESAEFAAFTLASEKARMYFVEQLVICNTFHAIEKRCARWILSMADRANAEHYSLTHEYLSFMLGVRRPAVTLAELSLQKSGAIEYRRGYLRIVDRPLLESLTCECYDATNAVFATAVGKPRVVTATSP
jgi:CRP-like cAMP-binding protein